MKEKTRRQHNFKKNIFLVCFFSLSFSRTIMMLQAATRRAQRALLSRLALAGGEGKGGAAAAGGFGFQRGAATDAPLSSATTAPPTTPPPRYSPPKTPRQQVPIPTLNFWESTRPSEWKISHQYWFLAGVGALSLWATAKALSADADTGEGRGGNGGGNGGNEAGEKSKVTGGMSPAMRGMVAEQESSPVKKQVP